MFSTVRSPLAPMLVLAGLEPMAMVLPSLQRGLPPIALSRSPIQAVALAETIAITDDEEEADWDSLEREVDVKEKVEA